MAEVKAVEILLDALIVQGQVYNAGDVIIDPPEDLLKAADEKRIGRDGLLMCRRLDKKAALSAAKRADAGDESVVVMEEEVVEEVEPDLETE